MLRYLSFTSSSSSIISHNECESGRRTTNPPAPSLLMRFLDNHKGKILLLAIGTLACAWVAGSIALGVFSLGVTVPYSLHLSLGLFALGAVLFGISAYRAKSGSLRTDELPEKIIRKPRGKRSATLYFMRPTQFRMAKKRQAL